MIQIRAYFDKTLLYSNRKIVDLTQYAFDTVTLVSFNGGNTIDASLIFNMTSAMQVPTYVQIIGGSFDGYQYYVTDIKFIKKAQYRLTLLRDLISESNLWRDEDAYIERGYTADDFLKFNRHKFNLNMIKRDQKILTDDLSLVMFFNHAQNNNAPVPLDISAMVSADLDPNLIVGTYDSNTNPFPFKGGDWQTGEIAVMENARYNFNVAFGSLNSGSPNTRWGSVPMNSQLNESTVTRGTRTIQGLTISHNQFMDMLENSWADFMIRVQDGQDFTNNQVIDAVRRVRENPAIANILAKYTSFRDDYRQFNGKYVQIDGQVYEVAVTETWRRVATGNYSFMGGTPAWFTRGIKTLVGANTDAGAELTRGALADICRNAFNASTGRNLTQQNATRNYGIGLRFDYLEVKVDLIAVQPTQYLQGQIQTTHPFMREVPCKALVVNGLTRDTYQQWVNWAVVVMQQQPTVIECQLVPFNVQGDFYIPNLTLGGVAFTGVQALTERDHFYDIDIAEAYAPNNEFVEKEGRMVRISSGSYASNMDLTPFLNNGLSRLETRLSVKPMGTIIYMQPDFAGLYGTNYVDKRGFIMQEDFSISRLDNAWVQFRYQNQNFMNTFNRQMQSMELNNYYASEADRLALDRADIEGRRLARENTASEWGMFNTALLGIPSLIGGSTHKSRQQYNEAVQLDAQMNEALRRDNVELTKQLFNNNMGNIKALAPTLNKVDTFDILNHFSIILEVFECSGAEMTYIQNYYEHNGAVIGTIGRFSEFWGLVVAGRIIRSQYYSQVELKELNRRLEGGVYTGRTVQNILEGVG